MINLIKSARTKAMDTKALRGNKSGKYELN